MVELPDKILLDNLMLTWNIRPELVSFGPVVIRWYGFFFSLAFAAGFQISKKIFAEDGIGTSYLDRLVIYIGIGTIVGARLGHCLFYEPEIYLHNPLRILKIWEGGLASHGAVIGVIVSLILFSKKDNSLTLFQLFDRVAAPAALAGAFIRLG